jgi:ABC-type polysaccharide/polyol phosphate transport system ATPase subunit
VTSPNDTEQPLVTLTNVGKRYTKYDDAPMLLTRALKFRPGTKRSKRWAIRGVDLAVNAGETVGVIGRNGSGKSTLLRMLAGVTAPTEGRVSVRGRVAPLISVGVGFHPELTGRENIYVNGSLLGMTRADIDDRADAIIEFAEIPEFIDTPVKFYSSGMFVRLGFSVAVAAEPHILLVDEVLAVGDIGFQIKSFERMRAMQARGTTILVVSHNLNAIRNLCERVLVVHDGSPEFLGGTDEAISLYHELLDRSAAVDAGLVDGRAPVEIVRFDLLDRDGQPTAHLAAGEEAEAAATVRFHSAVERPAFSLVLVTESGVPVYIDSTYLVGVRSFAAGEETTCRVRFRARLTTGSYTVRLGILWDEKQGRTVNSRPVLFYVSGRPLVSGVADLQADFEIDESA